MKRLRPGGKHGAETPYGLESEQPRMTVQTSWLRTTENRARCIQLSDLDLACEAHASNFGEPSGSERPVRFLSDLLRPPAALAISRAI